MMKEKVNIHATGDDALDHVRSKLEQYLDSNGTVTDIDLSMTIKTESDNEIGNDKADSETENGPNRELSEIRPDTRLSQVLQLIADNPDSTIYDLEDESELDRSQISPVLTKLWEHKLTEREKVSRSYHYWINDHGKAMLEQLDES